MSTKKRPPKASGSSFCPSDEVLVGFHLRKKLLGQELPSTAIREVDVYSYHPKNLTSKLAPSNRIFEWYFFTPMSRKHESGRWRSTSPGCWKATGVESDVSVVGLWGCKQSFSYVEKTKVGEEIHTDWLMDEYTIKNAPRFIKNRKKLHEWMLCKVRLTAQAQARNEAELAAALRKVEEPSSSDETFVNLGVSKSGKKPLTADRHQDSQGQYLLQSSRSRKRKAPEAAIVYKTPRPCSANL